MLFDNVLIVGAGPVAVQVAVNIRPYARTLGIASRESVHYEKTKIRLKENRSTLRAKGSSDSQRKMGGVARVDWIYESLTEVEDIWDVVFLCVPSDGYCDVLDGICPCKRSRLKTIVLISPTLGSNQLVQAHLKQNESEAEIISFSSYYGATKFEKDFKDSEVAFTKAIKKRIYIASNSSEGKMADKIAQWIETLQIQCTVMDTPFDAECRSITTYVHPALFINDFALEAIAGQALAPKWMYKLYPEGPINQKTIQTMVDLWKEISVLVEYLGSKPINLLKFLNDDNYPVREETLSRNDIENYNNLEDIHQQYLLYLRYSAILIDPFSQPDQQGRYFDFSAVPFKTIYQNKSNQWCVPRVPHEDYKKIKFIYEWASLIGVAMPESERLIEKYQQWLERLEQKVGKGHLNSQLFTDTSKADAQKMMEEMEMKI